LVTPVWFILVPGPHDVPIAWQVPQLVLVIGATVCAKAALVGLPATGTACPATLWQPEVAQFVEAVTPVWL
jgi:hypothetical protein